MLRLLPIVTDTAIAAVFLIPIFAYLDKKLFRDPRRTLFYGIFAAYLCGVFAVAGLPNICYIRFDLNGNLRPFAHLFSDYRSSCLNVLMFVPLGIFLPLLWKPFRKLWRALLFGFGTSLMIELLQIFTYRSTDINDLMTNTFGTLLGWFVGILIAKLVPNFLSEGDKNHAPLVCGISFGVMFFLHPFAAMLLNR